MYSRFYTSQEGFVGHSEFHFDMVRFSATAVVAPIFGGASGLIQPFEAEFVE